MGAFWLGVFMSYYDFRRTENAILEIQGILRNLDFYENDTARVKPDGIYGDDTRALVSEFQKRYGIEPSGVVDFETWKLLHAVDKARREEAKVARAVHIFPIYEKHEILPNTQNSYVYIIQVMLNEILNDHDGFNVLEINGVYDLPTQNAVKLLRRKSLNEAPDIIDALVFETIADEYERVNSRSF